MYKIRLSPYHKIFYNEWKLDPSSSKYNIVFDQTISKNLDIPRLKKALSRFIHDYLIFNSHIVEIDGEAYWVKNSQINQLETFDGEHTKEQIFKYVSHPFDLVNEPLYRFAVFKEATGNYRFIIITHHMLIDGPSVNILMSEVSKYYNDKKYRILYSIDEQIFKITTTSVDLTKNLENNEKKGKYFWKSLLNNVESIDFSFLKTSQRSFEYNVESNQIREICFSFDRSILTQLKQINKKYKIGTFFYGQMILGILVHKYTSQKKFAIACPVAIKKHLHLMYGVGINILAVPYDFTNDFTIQEVIESITHTATMIIDKLNVSTIISEITAEKGFNLFEVFFSQTNLKNTPLNFVCANTLNINHEFDIDLSCKILFEQEIQSGYEILRKYHKTVTIFGSARLTANEP